MAIPEEDREIELPVMGIRISFLLVCFSISFVRVLWKLKVLGEYKIFITFGRLYRNFIMHTGVVIWTDPPFLGPPWTLFIHKYWLFTN